MKPIIHLLLPFICIALYIQPLNAQNSTATPNDTLEVVIDNPIEAIANLTTKFFELEKSTSQLENFDQSLKDVQTTLQQVVGSYRKDTVDYNNTLNTLESNVKELETQQKNYAIVAATNQTVVTELSSQRQTALTTELDNVCHKIVGTSEFVKSANVSLNALVLSNALTEYLNQVADLNSPNNTDLGFSITERVTEMVEQDIIANSKKQSKGKGKFLQVVKNIVANPLIQTLTVPVSTIVNSLSDVSNTVTQVALSDDDITVEQIENFKINLRKYVTHYQGLSNATADFDDKITNINIRIVALQELLYNFTAERIETLFPDKTMDNEDGSLTHLIRQHYDFRQVEKEVKSVRKGYDTDADLAQLLAEPRLQYPSYALSQSRMIYDEIDALYQEYLKALKDYQTNIEIVLDKSREIGESGKIDQKIKDLQGLLLGVEDALQDAVNVEDVEQQFFELTRKNG